jgi:hypothetical protein
VRWQRASEHGDEVLQYNFKLLQMCLVAGKLVSRNIM